MEQRLIDANPIFDKVEANYRMSEGVQHECEREFLNLICNEPTVDAVHVVRCKDCKWWKPNAIGICKLHDIRPTPIIMDNWFCSDGERGNDD